MRGLNGDDQLAVVDWKLPFELVYLNKTKEKTNQNNNLNILLDRALLTSIHISDTGFK